MILAKIETWEQKKNIILNKSKLKERKGCILMTILQTKKEKQKRS
jgi:hypothetical protein